MNTVTPVPRRCVVVGGCGAVGGMIAALLSRSGARVCVVDTAPPAAPVAGQRFVTADITRPGSDVLDELAAADLVVLAVAEPVGLASIPVVTGAMYPDALLAETMSVKTPIATTIRATGVQALGINPMFAPVLGMAGRPVAVVVHQDGPRVAPFLRVLSDGGATLVTVDAQEHDRLTAAAQVLTHAAVLSFGLALEELDVDIEKLSSIAPPPHACMLSLLARIASGAPEVYRDIQEANPMAAQARGALSNAVRRLTEVTETDGSGGFAAVLRQMQAVLGPELGRYRELCARTFDTTAPSPGRTRHSGQERYG